MLIVALTGGIGSGKSLVGRYFSDLGARVVDADDLARRAIERGTVGFDEVVATFGDAILSNGEINRSALAERVFSDPDARRELESIVHPRVREGFDFAVKSLQPDEVLIYEIPLLVETGAHAKFDYVITVESSDESRFRRLGDRGMSNHEITKRMASQTTQEARRQVADFVISNDSTSDDLLRQVEFLWESVFPGLQRDSR